MKKSLLLSFLLLFGGIVAFSNVIWGEEPGKQPASVSPKAEQKKLNSNDWDPDWDDQTEVKDAKAKPESSQKNVERSENKSSSTGKADGRTDKSAAEKTAVPNQQNKNSQSDKKQNPATVNASGSEKKDAKVKAPEFRVPAKVPASASAASLSDCPIESVIPGKSIAVLKISSLTEFNVKGKQVLNDLDISTYAPLDWLKYTPFGRAIDNMVQDSSVALAIIPRGKEYGHVLFFPVKNYEGFATALGARKASLASDEKPGVLPENTCVPITLPKGYFICGYRGYALLISENLRDSLSSFYDRGTLADSRKMLRPILKNSVLSLEVYQEGVRQIAKFRQNGLKGFSLDINKWIESVNKSLDGKEKIKINPKMVKRWNDFLDRTQKNLRYFQIDMDVEDGALLTAVTALPADRSPMMNQIEDKTDAETPLYFTEDKFTKIVPGYSAPVTGQIDLSPTAASSLESPYNQIRHVEYSLILPGDKDFLARNWCIFLEVVNAKGFVHELVVPKAQYVGGYTGAEMGSELAGRIFGNMAVRRQNRGRPANPEAAAASGSSLGARLGERLGQIMGEKEATTIFDFDGFPLYVADTEFYTRKMAEIKARQEGEIVQKPVMLNGEYTLINSVLGVLGGQENELTSLLNRSAAMNDKKDGQSPNLIAKKSLFLVLDDTHLLIVPGNRDLLREAKNNWVKMLEEVSKKNPSKPLKSAQASRETWSILWEIMNREIVDASRQQIRSITRIDPPSIKYLSNYLNTYYLKNSPLHFNSIPNNTPEALFFTTTSRKAFHVYYVAPLKTVSALVGVIKENNKTIESKQSEK